MADLQTQRQEVFDYVNAMLGGGMIDVELDPVHYETALNKALTRFRQRSDNGVEESYLFMETIEDVNEYTLPNEVIKFVDYSVDQLVQEQVAVMAARCLNRSILHIQIPTYYLQVIWED